MLAWIRFEATVSPLPDRLADLHNALACSTMVNLQRTSDSPPVTPREFFVIKDQAPDDDGLTEAERGMTP